jgi:hypothetical protein
VARALSPFPDEPGLLEHPQVLRHGRPADGEAPRDLDDRSGALPQPFEDGTARRISERCDSICVSHRLP